MSLVFAHTKSACSFDLKQTEGMTQWIIGGFWSVFSVRPGLDMLWKLCWCEPLWLPHLENLSGFGVISSHWKSLQLELHWYHFLYHLFRSIRLSVPPTLYVSRETWRIKCSGVAEAVGNFIRFYMETELLVQWGISLDTKQWRLFCPKMEI